MQPSVFLVSPFFPVNTPFSLGMVLGRTSASMFLFSPASSLSWREGPPFSPLPYNFKSSRPCNLLPLYLFLQVRLTSLLDLRKSDCENPPPSLPGLPLFPELRPLIRYRGFQARIPLDPRSSRGGIRSLFRSFSATLVYLPPSEEERFLGLFFVSVFAATRCQSLSPYLFHSAKPFCSLFPSVAFRRFRFPSSEAEATRRRMLFPFPSFSRGLSFFTLKSGFDPLS